MVRRERMWDDNRSNKGNDVVVELVMSPWLWMEQGQGQSRVWPVGGNGSCKADLESKRQYRPTLTLRYLRLPETGNEKNILRIRID